jgi:ABC-2 type transport system ATP-binding protein
MLQQQPFVREIQELDGGLNVYVETGETDLPRILRVLDGNGLTVQTISLSRPTLDDVFLKYTGRTMRGEEGQPTTWARMQRDNRRRR